MVFYIKYKNVGKHLRVYQGKSLGETLYLSWCFWKEPCPISWGTSGSFCSFLLFELCLKGHAGGKSEASKCWARDGTREAAGQQCLVLRTTYAWFICEFISTHSSLPGATQPAVRSVIFFVLLTACDLSLINTIYCTMHLVHRKSDHIQTCTRSNYTTKS